MNCTVLYCTALYSAIPYYTVVYYTVLSCTALTFEEQRVGDLPGNPDTWWGGRARGKDGVRERAREG
jgi:hypothetical protein